MSTGSITAAGGAAEARTISSITVLIAHNRAQTYVVNLSMNISEHGCLVDGALLLHVAFNYAYTALRPHCC